MPGITVVRLGDPKLEVDIQTLEPGDPFRFDDLQGQWVYGHLIFKNASRVRAVVYDQPGRRRKAWDRADADEAGMVKTDGSGDTEMNLPLSMKVEVLTAGRYTPTFNTGYEKETEMAEVVVDGAKAQADPVKAAGLKAKYAHQQKQWALARQVGDTAKAGVALQRIKAIEQEADAAGVELPEYDVDRAPEGESVQPTQSKVKLPIQKKTKAQEQEEKAIERAKEKAQTAKSKGVEKGAAATKSEPKAKKPSKTHDCLCGCGRETLSLYAPGHDARVKGLLLKVERGELGKDAIPETVVPFVKWSGKWKTENFALTAAPVKIPGRDEVENTSLSAMEAMDV